MRHNKYVLGHHQGVAPRGPSYHQIIKMSSDSHKSASCPSIISIPGLIDSGVSRSEVPNKGEYPQAICDYGQGFFLGHPLLSVKEVNRPVTRPDHHCGPVEVEIE